MKTPRLTFIAALLTVFALWPAAAQAQEDLVIQGTTDVRDAGLVDDLLVPGFEAAYPQYNLQYIAVGTGQALANARAGQGDAVITHAPTLEAQFVFDGYSLEPTGRAIFYSDYVILGPLDDPAGILTGSPHDAAGAYELIGEAGEAGEANFVSRGDNSGTNVQEKIIWQLTDVGLNDANEPGTGATSNPDWYHKAGLGQAATVLLTQECPFDNGNCYEMTDRGTFNRLVSTGAVTELKIVSDRNTPQARGGENLLINPFSTYIVNPDKVPTVNVEGAKAFVTYLTSRQFQAQLKNFPNPSSPAFFADARPKVTAGSRLPKRAVRGGRQIVLRGAIENLLPGAPSLANALIVLERVVKRKNQPGFVFKQVRRVRTNATGRYTIRFQARRKLRGAMRIRIPIIFPNLQVEPLHAVGSLQEETVKVGKLKVKPPKRRGR